LIVYEVASSFLGHSWLDSCSIRILMAKVSMMVITEACHCTMLENKVYAAAYSAA